MPIQYEPIQGLPYPDGSTLPDGPAQIKALADAVAPKLMMVFATTSARDVAITSPSAGMRCFVGSGSAMAEYVHNGTAWRPLRGYCRAVATSAQSIATATATNLSFGATTQNVDTMWVSGSPTVITIPWAGWWNIAATGSFAFNASGYRTFAIQASTAGKLAQSTTPPPPSPAPAYVSLAASAYLAAGETVTLLAYQTSGGALSTYNDNLYPTLSVWS